MAGENVDVQDNTKTVTSTDVNEDTLAEGQGDLAANTLLAKQGNTEAPKVDGDAKPTEGNADPGKSTSETKPDTGDGEQEDALVGIDYEALEIPEGYTVDFEAYKEQLEQAGFNQKQVQTILNMGAEKAKKDFETDQAAFDRVQDEMQKASREDKEFGGANFEQNIGQASKALNAFGTPELMKYLTDSGAGNHPEVIRAFVRVGKAISEDAFLSPEGGYGSGAPKKEREEVMYPSMIKNKG